MDLLTHMETFMDTTQDTRTWYVYTSYKNKLGQTEAGIPGSEGMEQFK